LITGKLKVVRQRRGLVQRRDKGRCHDSMQVRGKAKWYQSLFANCKSMIARLNTRNRGVRLSRPQLGIVRAEKLRKRERQLCRERDLGERDREPILDCCGSCFELPKKVERHSDAAIFWQKRRRGRGRGVGDITVGG